MSAELLRPADIQQRAESLQVDSSFIVQAPAGSGKTELLSMRFLKLLSMVDDPSKVLAVTFTRKATREMLDRIMLRISQAQAKQEPSKPHELEAYQLALKVSQQSQKYGWALEKNPALLQILTIDGLSSRLAGMGRPESARLRVTENAKPLYLEASQRLIEDAASDPESSPQRLALEAFLFGMRGSQGKIAQLVADRFEQRDQWLSGISGQAFSAEEILQKRQQLELDHLTAHLGIANLECLGTLLEQLSGLADETPDEPLVTWGYFSDPEQALRCIYNLLNCVTTASGSLNAKRSLNSKVFKGGHPDRAGLIEELGGLLESWRANDATAAAIERFMGKPPFSVVAQDSRLIEDMRRLLILGYAQLRVLFSERGVCDFQHIAELALESLGNDLNPGEALLIEDGRLEHILVDEFQDTSQVQYQLLERLTAGWQPDDGRTLFLVGDPMQSIYRFRKAEVSLFQRVYETGQLGTVSVKPLILSSNFRSRSEIIKFVNQRCGQFFSRPSPVSTGAVAYTRVDAELGEGGCVGLHPRMHSGDNMAEPQAIAELVTSVLEKSPQSSVGILAQKRSLLQPVAEALTNMGVNFEAVGVQALTHRPIVQDLLILTRALMHPGDRIAWLGVLTGPWCGVSPEYLERLAGTHPGVDILANLADDELLSGLEPEVRARVEHTEAVMSSAVELASALSLSRRVEIAWVRLAGPLVAAGRWDLANAQTYVELLARLEKENPTDFLKSLEQGLEKLFAQTAPSDVQLMTIHKAKGLEFDVVILPGLDATTQADRGGLFRQKDFNFTDGTHGSVIAPADADGFKAPSIYRYLGKLDAEEVKCEYERLLYVALTRARQELHLFGQWKWMGSGANKKPGVQANTFMSLLWPAFEQRVTELDQAGAGPQPAVSDAVIEGPFPSLRLNNLPAPAFKAARSAEPQKVEPYSTPDRDALALGDALHLWLELINNHPDVFFTGEELSVTLAHRKEAMESSLLSSGARPESVSKLHARLFDLLLKSVEDDARMARPLGDELSWAEVQFCRREGDTLQLRIVDRLMLDENDEFVIVDYKTGQASPLTEEKWGEQLGVYREIVESATGNAVSQSCIYTPGEQALLKFGESGK